MHGMFLINTLSRKVDGLYLSVKRGGKGDGSC